MNGIELKSPAFAGMRGAYAAMFTPYGADGKVNEAMIEKLVEHGNLSRHAVACHARLVKYDGDAFARDPIEKRGFAHIRASYD